MKHKLNTENILPLVALRGLVVFPGSSVSFDVTRPASMDAIEKALNDDKKIFLVTQKNILKEKPKILDLYKIGCVARIKQYAKISKNVSRVMVDVISRARLENMEKVKNIQYGEFYEIEEENPEEVIVNQAFIRALQEMFEEYIKISKKPSPDKIALVFPSNNIGRFADGIIANVNCDFEIKQEILETIDVYDRMEKLLVVLKNEIEIIHAKNKIDQEVKKSIDENQREYYLREEMKAIEKELGDKDGFSEEIVTYKKNIKELGLENEYEEKLIKEAERMAKMQPSSPENAVVRAYLDNILELPWNVETTDSEDINKASEILDNDHYGLENVKERVLEHLAVHNLTDGKDGTVLCLSGPPGTGKTSVASSIARALGRKFVRISLGGVRDEADIRGHRKTYVASMPGRIIDAIKQAGSKNPVILLDEIDKMGSDYKGDPTSALLEVLDFEQNNKFRDHYLEIPFDLSQVMFIATANNLSNIPAPLLDRVEVIEIPGYTNPEKFQIAKKYLIPKQIEKNGLKGKRVNVTDDAINDIINYYTKEAGVRGLERKISSLMRKLAKVILSGEKKSAKVTAKNLEQYLGKKKYSFDMKNNKDEVGTVRGLAWTSVGGDTLSVEVNVMAGTGKIELTGNLGDVMKESAMTAVSYIRSKSDSLKIEEDFYKTKDIHIHVPEGAVPKDGPSAGITIATAVASALTNRAVKCDVAMTGEITLRGNVLPIGGLREKSLAAYRAGIKTVIIPDKNSVDISDIPEEIRNEINFIPVTNMENVLKNALSN